MNTTYISLTTEPDKLTIKPLNDEELAAIILAEQDAHLKQAYETMLSDCENCPEERLWSTLWSINTSDNIQLGTIAFMGKPENGEVEIGYGIYKEHEGRGYVTEALKAMLSFAFSCSEIEAVTAQTEPENAASQRVLEKADFVKCSENKDVFVYKKERSSSR